MADKDSQNVILDPDEMFEDLRKKIKDSGTDMDMGRIEVYFLSWTCKFKNIFLVL